jgi:hypothetical protein
MARHARPGHPRRRHRAGLVVALVLLAALGVRVGLAILIPFWIERGR